jgi:hypothetical protein
MDTGDECKLTFEEASKNPLMTSEPGSYICSGMSMGDTYLLPIRCPAYRRHESYPGSRAELDNRVGDDKGKCTSGQSEAESTEALARDGLLRSSEEAG